MKVHFSYLLPFFKQKRTPYIIRDFPITCWRWITYTGYSKRRGDPWIRTVEVSGIKSTTFSYQSQGKFHDTEIFSLYFIVVVVVVCVLVFQFVQLVFWFLDHTSWTLGLSHGSVLKDHSWRVQRIIYGPRDQN